MLVLKENRISFIQAAIVLVIILAEIFLFRKVLMNAYIPSESMEPTFTEGMRLIATRGCYHLPVSGRPVRALHQTRDRAAGRHGGD